MRTGQFAYLITAEGVIPNNKFLIPDLPLLTITINFLLFQRIWLFHHNKQIFLLI